MTVAAMVKANAAIRPHLIDLPIEDLYEIITDVHESVVEAIHTASATKGTATPALAQFALYAID